MATGKSANRRAKSLIWLAALVVLAAGLLITSWAISQTDPRQEALALAYKFLGRSPDEVRVVRFSLKDHQADLKLAEGQRSTGNDRRASLDSATVSMTVDLERGYVRSASWAHRVGAKSPGGVTPILQARQKAETFARAHFPRPWSEQFQLVYAKSWPVGAQGDPAPQPLSYNLVWQQMRGEAKVGTHVSVTVDAATGEIHSYWALLAPRDDPPEPRLTRAQAQEEIESMLKRISTPRAHAEADDLNLVLSSIVHPQGGPVWIAGWMRWSPAPEGYEGPTRNGEMSMLGGVIVIDALTGELLEGPGKPRKPSTVP